MKHYHTHEEISNLDLTQIRSTDTAFMVCDLNGVSFVQAEMISPIFKHVTFNDCNLTSTQMYSASLKCCNLNNTSNCIGLNIENSDLEKVSFKNADLRGAVFENVRGDKVCFKNADLRGAKFVDSVFKDADFRGADLRGAEFLFTDIRDCKFHKALIEDADFRTAQIGGTCLRSLSDSAKFNIIGWINPVY